VEFFKPIEPLILGPAPRVMSLRDATKKMSKSDPSEQSRINLNDDADTIALKVRRAKTDPEPLPGDPAALEGRPEARNLVGIYAALSGTDQASVLREHGGSGFGTFKEALTVLLIDRLTPIARETERRLADPVGLDSTLRNGAARAAAIAEPVLDEVQQLIGFLKA
jgi:tryptophanyl-tRNA synthetase